MVTLQDDGVDDVIVKQARDQVSHALRLLRIALREHPGIASVQLRFRLGLTYALDENIYGWIQREDAPAPLTLDGKLVELARDQPISVLPRQPLTDIDKKADLALRWMERAWVTGEPLVALLYLFFALEAMLGDRSEGLKAHGLAFRQTMLSHITTGGFSNPNRTWFLYDRVRSGAVHGEDAPLVNWDMVSSFRWVVRRALNQYVGLTQKNNIVKRGRLLRLLDEHADRPQLIAWLRRNGGPIWNDYLDRLENAGEKSC